MAATHEETILILAKTYPSPSAKYIETSCVAGINKEGLMRRLYPIPFRMLDDNQKFKKWQWIKAKVEKTNRDHRPESHTLFIDTIETLDIIDTKKQWSDRKDWIAKIPSFASADFINSSESKDGPSIALIRPKRLIDLEINESGNKTWTEDEKNKLTQMQIDLFDELRTKREVNELKKIPYNFYYKYSCDTPDGEKEYTHKIVDWEAGMLFWNCFKRDSIAWKKQFRNKLLNEFGERNDLMFLMGNQHRFQDQWLIISLIYPPKQKLIEQQGSLF